MSSGILTAAWLTVFSAVAPSSQEGVAGPGKPFLDQSRDVGPHLEWNREVVSKKGGAITFRVTSQGPFAVTVVTGKAYEAVRRGARKGLNKQDLLLTIDSTETTYEGKVAIPPGSAWFIIENLTDMDVKITLQCFAP